MQRAHGAGVPCGEMGYACLMHAQVCCSHACTCCTASHCSSSKIPATSLAHDRSSWPQTTCDTMHAFAGSKRQARESMCHETVGVGAAAPASAATTVYQRSRAPLT